MNDLIPMILSLLVCVLGIVKVVSDYRMPSAPTVPEWLGLKEHGRSMDEVGIYCPGWDSIGYPGGRT